MKRILSLMLAIMMLVSAIPAAYATTSHTNGTQVEYNAETDNDGDGQPDNVESYTVTVPALLAPGGAGNVVAQGTWASNRKLVVTADEDVTLTNSINAADQKVLDVEFPGIGLVGSNTAAVSDTKEVSVADIETALFGTWSGKFNYNVEMVDYIALPEKNEYGFYYNAPYFREDNADVAWVFQEDGELIYYIKDIYSAAPGNYFNSYYSSSEYTYDASTHSATWGNAQSMVFSESGETFEWKGYTFKASGATHGIYYGKTYVNDLGDTIIINEDNTISYSISGSTGTVELTAYDVIAWQYHFQMETSTTESLINVSMYGDVLATNIFDAFSSHDGFYLEQ